ncbi:MAG TPA: DNA topoisomerase VI subunit B [Phycisphaerae bacterium]|nr:DNA topoisomerase VI subunit B [Phycisphaerae bacterium]
MVTTSSKRERVKPAATDQLQFPFDGAGVVAHRTVPPEPTMPTKTKSPPAKTADQKKTRKNVPSSEPVEKAASAAPAPPADSGRNRKPPKARKFATAESMSKSQREISVSEFFAKNRHLLGFDNKRKALLTTVKEAVDNSLDACEEAGILPDIRVKIEQTEGDRFRVNVRDNGPGIVKHQIPNVFGKLLYGSKFHRLKMSRGQQGIGISAAGMYGLLTTGKSVLITSRTGAKQDAHYYELQIDTNKNAPKIVVDKTVKVDWDHGTEVAIELVAEYKKGRGSVDEYLELTAISNPHASFALIDPAGSVTGLPRGTQTAPEPTTEIKPHPYGIELGVLIKMLHDTKTGSLAQFLQQEFSRVGPGVAKAICEKAKLSSRARPVTIGTHEAETLYKAMQETPIRPPQTDCLSPIGPEQILAGLLKGVKAEFFTANTRSPAVYRGNPFQIEVGLAYGGELGPDPVEEAAEKPQDEVVVRRGKVVEQTRAPSQAKLMRYANRVPLLYQGSGCCITKSVIELDWRRYGLSQSSGAMPQGPLAIFIHMASVWVPFTSEGKEAIADYDEIRKEIKLAVQECARRLQGYLNKRQKKKYETDRRSIFERYIGEVVSACSSIAPVNREKLRDDLLVIAKRVTARADQEFAMDGSVKKAGENDGREFGEHTIVVDGGGAAPGPLFEGDRKGSDDEA